MGKLKTAILCGLAAIAFHAAATMVPASAHPHVFVKVKAQLIIKDGALVSLRHTWMFDQSWLDNQLLEHDMDGDGKLSRAELAPLEAESQATLEMFRSFTVVRAGGALIRVTSPHDVVVDYHGSLLGLSFTATLAKPVPLAVSEIVLEAYDATYFSSFTFDGPDAVVFQAAAPAGCTIKSGVSASPQQMNAWRMIRKQMGAEWVDTGGVPKSVSIACAKPSPNAGGEPMAVHQPVSTR